VRLEGSEREQSGESNFDSRRVRLRGEKREREQEEQGRRTRLQEPVCCECSGTYARKGCVGQACERVTRVWGVVWVLAAASAGKGRSRKWIFESINNEQGALHTATSDTPAWKADILTATSTHRRNAANNLAHSRWVFAPGSPGTRPSSAGDFAQLHFRGTCDRCLV
jgi:hypothetical protein